MRFLWNPKKKQKNKTKKKRFFFLFTSLYLVSFCNQNIPSCVFTSGFCSDIWIADYMKWLLEIKFSENDNMDHVLWHRFKVKLIAHLRTESTFSICWLKIQSNVPLLFNTYFAKLIYVYLKTISTNRIKSTNQFLHIDKSAQLVSFVSFLVSL